MTERKSFGDFRLFRNKSETKNFLPLRNETGQKNHDKLMNS